MSATTATTTTAVINDMRQRPVGKPWNGLAAMTWSSFRGLLFNPANMGFSIFLPILMYFMFGVDKEYSLIEVGHGNISAAILTSMTFYAVLLSSAMFGASVALERSTGVARLYALTPMSIPFQVLARVLSVMAVAAITISVVYSVGFMTDARLDMELWFIIPLLMLVLIVPAIALGLAAGFNVRGEGAFSVASMVMVLSAFLSGMFVPLDQLSAFFRHIAPFTPLYAPLQIVQAPINGTGVEVKHILITIGWTVMFLAIAIWGRSRSTGR